MAFTGPRRVTRRRAWVQFCRNTSLQNKTPQQLRERAVCSRHFKPSAFLYRGRLRRDAVPADLTTEDATHVFESSSSGQLISHGVTPASGSSTSGPTSSQCHTHRTTEQDLGSSLTALTCGTKTSSSTRVHVDHTYALDGHGLPSGENNMWAPEPSTADYDSSATSTSAVYHQRSCGTRTDGKLETLRAKLRQLRKCNKRLQQRLQRRRHMLTVTEIVDRVRSLVSPAVAALVEAQLKMSNASRFGRRWCSQNKAFALGLYFHSPKGFRYCRQLLRLPSVRSLQLWLQRVPLRVGFYPEVFELVKRRAASFSPEDKPCIIVFDEMHVTKELSYNPSVDRFEGLEESSTGRGHNLANKALVFMAKGIRTPWKQPLGYFFAHCSTPANVLRDLLFQCHNLLVKAGLDPVAVACDQGNQNVALFNGLVTPEKPYITVNEKPLFFLFDVPHLLKCLRNMFFKYNFQVGDHTFKSSYLREAYEKDKQLEIRSMPRLSEKHFNLTFASKMSVKLAAQIFSNHCAAAMFAMVTFQQLPVEAIHTARFIERMDRLFDSLNSSQKRGKTAYVSGMYEGSVHKEFLQECLLMFESLNVLGCPRQPACIRGFCLTIRSVMLICEHLTSEYGFKYLLTRHLNQDALENTFAIIRSKSGANTNSSCRQFQAAFRHLLISNLFKLSDKSNCEEDMATLLAALPVGLSAPSTSLSLGSSLPQSAADLTPSSYPSSLSLNNMVYFAGWLVTRFFKFHTCQNVTQQCELQIKNATLSDESQVLLYLSVKGTAEGDFGSLSVPSPCFVSFVQACEQVFVASVDSLVLQESVGKKLCIILCGKVEKLLTLCSEDVYDDLFALFARVRLHWFARKKNTELLDGAVRRKTNQQVQRMSR